MSTSSIPKIVPAKRIFDLLFSVSAILITLPLFVLFFIAIFMEHLLRGRPFDPLVYKETRISQGKKFTIYKFNIFDQREIDRMRKAGIFIHTKQLQLDGKLISIGSFLKQIYLDEMPQLWNVLKGDMSIVGPRPLNEEVYAKLLEDRVPAISILKGGMTGLFQSYKGQENVSDLEIDRDYLNQYESRGGLSLVLYDIRIILRTLKVVLQAKGI